MLRRALAIASVVLVAAGAIVALARMEEEPVDGIVDRRGQPLADRVRLQMRSIGIEHGRSTLDGRIQGIAERALDRGIQRARRQQDASGRPLQASGGSVVVVDLRDDSVVALASGPELGLSRATVAAPPGSVMKPLSALAVIDGGIITAEAFVPCPAVFRYRGGVFRNWRPTDLGEMSISSALADSCNTVFYELAARSVAASTPGHTAIEDGFRAFGFGRATGVAPTEEPGALPRAVEGGQVVAMSVGQGPLRATPLQIARAYAALAHGRPGALRGLTGARTEPIGEPPSPAAARVVRDGLREVPRSGTAMHAFAGFPLGSVPVEGKTGSAEVSGEQAWSWFVAYAPSADPRYLVVASVEQGGQGSTSAAPIVRRVLERVRSIDPRAFEPPPPLLPDLTLLGFLALVVLVAGPWPTAGVLVGALLGSIIDRGAGFGLGPASISLAGAAWLFGRGRIHLPVPAAAGLAAVAGLTGIVVVGTGMGVVAGLRWDVTATQIATGSLAIAGSAALLVLMDRSLVRLRGFR